MRGAAPEGALRRHPPCPPVIRAWRAHGCGASSEYAQYMGGADGLQDPRRAPATLWSAIALAPRVMGNRSGSFPRVAGRRATFPVALWRLLDVHALASVHSRSLNVPLTLARFLRATQCELEYQDVTTLKLEYHDATTPRPQGRSFLRYSISSERIARAGRFAGMGER